jgi:small subunit ribosomal protein S18
VANQGGGRTSGSSIRPRRGPRGKFVPKRKVCPFCVEKGSTIDYKDPIRLGRFITDRGKIGPRRMTGACAKHQRAVAMAIKRARHLALLPYAPSHIHATGGVGISRGRGRSRQVEARQVEAVPQPIEPAPEPAAEVVSEVPEAQEAE